MVRLIRWLPAITFAAVGLWLGGFVQFVADLDREQPGGAPTADAIVVLTGGEGRLAAAMQLLENGSGRRLLISGVNAEIGMEDLRQVVPDPSERFSCCVDLDHTALNTIGNAKGTASWAASQGYRSLIIVTASYHMPRSLLELKAAAPDLDLMPYSVVPARVRLDAWWRWPGTVRLLAWEFTKYLASLVRLRMLGQL